MAEDEEREEAEGKHTLGRPTSESRKYREEQKEAGYTSASMYDKQTY